MLSTTVLLVEINDHHDHGERFKYLKNEDPEKTTNTDQNDEHENIQVEQGHLLNFVLFGDSFGEFFFVNHALEFEQ